MTMRKWIMSLVLCAALVFGFALMPVRATADEPNVVTKTVNYVDEYGVTQEVEATVLTGSEPTGYHSTSSGFLYFVTLGKESETTWYVAEEDISYARNDGFKLNMELKGDVCIIVADGKTLSVQNEIVGASHDWTQSYTLSIYGQSAQIGTVSASLVNIDTLNLYSGGLNTAAFDNGSSTVNIKGGTLNVSGDVTCETLDISGGTTVIGGEAWTASLTLGCRTADDSIKIGNYRDYYGTAKIDGDQILTDGSNSYSGESVGEYLHDNANGKTLRRAQYTVSFDAAGGSETASQTVLSATQASRPADPAREGYVFKNWYRVTDNGLSGAPFDFNTKIVENVSLKAVWQKTITLQQPVADVGTVGITGGADATDDANRFLACPGDTVTLSITPHHDDCAIGTVSVSPAEGDAAEIQPTDGVYAFTMPEQDVTVSATFTSPERTLNLILNGGQYGDFKVSVNGVEAATASTISEALNVHIHDAITITFAPYENGKIESFYLDNYDSVIENHKESEIVNNSYTFTMPAYSTGIVVRFGYRNPVETVSYVDEYGVTQEVEATVLTGSEPTGYHSTSSGFLYFVTLGKESETTWYVAEEDISYARNDGFKLNMELKGDVCIIVADGKTLSVQNEIVDAAHDWTQSYTLSIYGQSAQTGTVSASAVKCDALNLYSGGLNTAAFDNGSSTVNIKGGTLNVSGDVTCETLDISGGTTVIGGEAWTANLTLGCRTADDSITVGTYAVTGTAKIADDQTLRDDYGTQYSGTLSAVASANGRILRPAQFFTEFGTAEFTLPAQLVCVEDNVFEGLAMQSVYIPDGCEYIGTYAFRDCTGLKKIRIPAGCAVSADALDGCVKVYVFGAAGSSAETYCQGHTNCVFVLDTQN